MLSIRDCNNNNNGYRIEELLKEKPLRKEEKKLLSRHKKKLYVYLYSYHQLYMNRRHILQRNMLLNVSLSMYKKKRNHIIHYMHRMIEFLTYWNQETSSAHINSKRALTLTLTLLSNNKKTVIVIMIVTLIVIANKTMIT